MKPKHAWNRKRNGTHSNLRYYRNWKKRLSRLRVRRDGSIYIIVNNRQKMAGKPYETHTTNKNSEEEILRLSCETVFWR